MNNNTEYSMTIEELAEKLKNYQEKHGNGGCIKTDTEDYKNGYARAITDILWMIL